MATDGINLEVLVRDAENTLEELKGVCTAAQDVLDSFKALRDGYVDRNQLIRYLQNQARQQRGKNDRAHDVYYSALGEIGY